MESAGVPQEKLMQPTFGIHLCKLHSGDSAARVSFAKVWRCVTTCGSIPCSHYPKKHNKTKQTLGYTAVSFCQRICQLGWVHFFELSFPNILSQTQIKAVCYQKGSISATISALDARIPPTVHFISGKIFSSCYKILSKRMISKPEGNAC